MPTNGLSFNTIPDSITQHALAHNFSMEEKERREEMILNKEFYYGQQEQQLNLVNEDVDPAIINLLKTIVKKRAGLLYRKKLVREFEGPSQSVALLEQVYKDNKFDMFMKQLDLMTELTGSVLVHTSVSDDEEKYPSGIKLTMYDSSQFSAVSKDDDPLAAAAISLVREVTRLNERSTSQNPQVERVLRQQVWTEDSVVTYNGLFQSSGSMTNELTSSTANGLGYLPFYNVRAELVHDQYLGHAPSNSLRKLNEIVNQTLTHLLHIVKMQGFTPIALAGFQSGEGVTIHPGRAFSIPTGANAFVLDTNPKIEEMLKVIQYIEEKCFETSSVPKVAVVGGEGESGRELLVRFFPLLELFENKSVLFHAHELEIANLILKVAGLPSIEFLNINYPEEDLLPLSTDDDTLKQDLELSLKTPVDELMRRDADLDEEEATALYLANLEFNQRIRPTNPEDNGDKPNEQRDQESTTPPEPDPKKEELDRQDRGSRTAKTKPKKAKKDSTDN